MTEPMPKTGPIVGTAGHVDHGKTALVKALTGRDLDVLPEERDRGITIQLGVAALDLADGRRVSLVDVPGHERLVRTMVAGAAGLDAVLLCISAVDGVMPQTVEHLGVCRVLGIPAGAVVLTMADLVDDEHLALAAEEARDLVAGTFLEGAPIVAFSVVDGRGLPEIREVLAGFRSRERPVDGRFRLPIDRAFTRPGFGTIVRGTVLSGSIADGAVVRLVPGDRSGRVRGIQVHGEATDRARAGQRVALNLAGIGRTSVRRGVVVADGPVPVTRIVDVAYTHLPGAAPLDDGASVRLLVGTAESVGRLVFAEERERIGGRSQAVAQVRLDEAVACRPGDRFVLRRPSPADTLGGGTILDPWARRMRRRDRVAYGRDLRRLEAGDRAVFLERAGEEGLTPEEALDRCGPGHRGRRLGDRVFAPGVVGRLEGALLETIERFHRDQPLALGAGRRELRRGRLGHLSERVFDALVDALVAHGLAATRGPLVHLVGFEVRLDPRQQALRDAIAATVRKAGLDGIRTEALCAAHQEPETVAIAHLLAEEGEVTRVAGLGWVSREALDDLKAEVRRWFVDHDTLAPADLKRITGRTRRVIIPLLEWLDAVGVTRRHGDARVAGEEA